MSLDPRDRDLLTRLLEVRGARDPVPPVHAQPATPAAPVQEAPHPTAAQAAPRCRPIGFSTGLSRGTLRPEDVDELRKLSAQSDPAAFDELRRRIVVALNRDEIRLAEPRAGMP